MIIVAKLCRFFSIMSCLDEENGLNKSYYGIHDFKLLIAVSGLLN